MKEVEANWAKISPEARPFLNALKLNRTRSIRSVIGADSSEKIVKKLISAMRTWKGPVARRLKRELEEKAEEATT